jgi:hypothetical protein
MFLPPVANNEVWLNDAEGTQPRANVSYAIINDYYNRTIQAGFGAFSYFNVFEWGENICIHPVAVKGCVPTPGPPSTRAWWNNASTVLLRTFPDALLTDFDCGDHTNCENKFGAAYTYQNGVLVDPGVTQLHDFWLNQLRRKYEDTPAFQVNNLHRTYEASFFSPSHPSAILTHLTVY